MNKRNYQWCLLHIRDKPALEWRDNQCRKPRRQCHYNLCILDEVEESPLVQKRVATQLVLHSRYLLVSWFFSSIYLRTTNQNLCAKRKHGLWPNKNCKQLTDLPIPRRTVPILLPPSRDRLPSGNIWTQSPCFSFDSAMSIPCSKGDTNVSSQITHFLQQHTSKSCHTYRYAYPTYFRYCFILNILERNLLKPNSIQRDRARIAYHLLL